MKKKIYNEGGGCQTKIINEGGGSDAIFYIKYTSENNYLRGVPEKNT